MNDHMEIGEHLTSNEKAFPRSFEASFAPSTRSTVRTRVAKRDWQSAPEIHGQRGRNASL